YRTHLAVGAAMVLLLILGTVASLTFAYRAHHAQALAWQRLGEVTRARQEEARQRRIAEEALADSYLNPAFMETREGHLAGALPWLAKAAASSPPNEENWKVNQMRLRSWTQQVIPPANALPHPGDMVVDLSFHPRSRFLRTLTRAGRCHLWDLDRNQPLELPVGNQQLECATWNSDGRTLAIGLHSGQVLLLRFPELTPLDLFELAGPVDWLDFNRTGELLAVAAKGTVRIYDLAARHLRPIQWLHPQPVGYVEFSQNGERLLTWCTDGRTRVFSATS